MKKVFFGVLAVCVVGCVYAGTPTPFNATIINNSGQSLYMTIGALPDATHVVRPGNAMLCPTFANEASQQSLQWNLDPSLYPTLDPSPDIEVMFYPSPQSSSTSLANQSNACPIPSTLQPSGKAYPPSVTSGPVLCTNSDPAVKYGGIKFSTYSPGILSINSDGKGGLICTLNAYTYTSEPIPYRVLNVGQNYLPPGGGTSKSGPLPTADDAIINLGAYLGNMNGSTPVPITYTVTTGPSQMLITADGSNQAALLQISKGQIFVQHNIGSAAVPAANTYQSLYTAFGCAAKSGFCTPYLDQNGKTVSDKFVLWPTISASVIVGPAATDAITTSQTFPVVISNAIRAKTVTELINQRMGQLVLNAAQGKAPAIADSMALHDPIEGTWLAHNSTTQLAANLMPDGADQIIPDIKDYLAISATPSDASNIKIDLSQYFVAPHKTPVDTVSYYLDASYLQPDPNTVQGYGSSTSLGSNTLPPIVGITGIGQVTFIAGVTAGPDGHGYTTAGPFSISSGGILTVTGSLTPEMVYQINVHAVDQTTGATAFNTFYLYVSAKPAATTYAEWQDGAEPSFSVLNYQPDQKFGTAYLYTSHDFTKSYDQKNWEASITTLLQDLGTANEHGANIQSAFVDVNNLSFQNNQGYWPVVTSGNYSAGNVESSITSAGMSTNLSYIDTTTGQTQYLLEPLLNYLNQESSGPHIALTVYPANNLKADFTGFDDQQQKIFADMSAIPALDQNSGIVDGISVDLEGGLNSTGDTQFYKLLADELAYQGKWFSFFYFATVESPSFAEALGPLGALEVSSYDVGTYREPGNAPATNLADGSTQTILPGTVPLDSQGWSQPQIKALYGAYFADSKKCDQVAEGGGNYVLTSHSWCNNSTNQSYSENTRLWTSFVQAENLLYADPIQNMALFNGKFHLIVPVSWSATQYTNLYLFNPDLTSTAQGLFMRNESQASACSSGDINACLFGNADPILNLAVQAVTPLTVVAQNKNTVAYLQISSLPGTTKNGGTWSGLQRQGQIDYMQTNYSAYQDALVAAQALNPALKTVNQVNFSGVGAYALELFENVPSNVTANAMGIEGSPTNAAMQSPWYVGFTPDTIPGTQLQPGYNKDTNAEIWQAFSALQNDQP